MVLDREGKASTVSASGVIDLSSLASEADGKPATIVVEKRVPKGVRISEVALVGALYGEPPATVRTEERVEPDARVYTLTVEGLKPVASEGGGCCGESGAPVVTYVVDGLCIDPRDIADVAVTCAPARIKSGRSATLELAARVGNKARASGAATFMVPQVLAGAMTRLGEQPNGARVVERSPAAVVAWPVETGPDGEEGPATFQCSLSFAPTVAGDITIDNAFELRLAVEGLPAACAAVPCADGCGADHCKAQRIICLHAPIGFRVAE